MAEYLDNIFTDEDLSSKEFLDEINKDISDITGYQETNEKENKPKESVEVDPLDEVLAKETVEIIEVKKNIINDMPNEDKVKFLRKPRDKGSISIDDNNDIFCKSWGNYYIEGGEFYEESVMIINEYFEECEKPVSARNFSKFVVGKKNVIEKFNDMDLHRGKIDFNGFFENIV